MKAAFIHDHYFVYSPSDGKYYDGSGGVFDEKLWNRYLAIFDSLIVVGRQKEDLPNKLVDSTCAKVTFELRDELKTSKDRFLKKALVKKNLEKTLAKVDFAIIRLPSVLGYIAQEICEESKIRYTLEVVACPWDAYINYGNFKGKIIAPLEFKKLKRATQNASNAIYVTQYFLQKRYPSSANTIGISNVNIDEVIDNNVKDEFFNKFDPSKDVFKIALIGSFHVKYKGHIEALNALKFILDKKEITNPKLYFVGTGNAEWIVEYAQKLGITKHVEIVGTVNAGKAGIFPFLDKMHVYIHPSKQEGLPRVVIEALSRGRLALGSTAAGIPELIEAKYLHKPGDWEKLAQGIIEMYHSRSQWKEITNKNILKAKEYLEIELQERRVKFIKNIVSK